MTDQDVKLIELGAKWLRPDLLVFLCPHCRKDWLAISRGFVKAQDQFDAFEKEFGENWNLKVVPAPEHSPWTFNGDDLSTLTITPSVDASRSGEGHWHGFVTNGECR